MMLQKQRGCIGAKIAQNEPLPNDPLANNIRAIRVVAERPGEGRLNELAAAAQSWRLELLFMPQSCQLLWT